MTHTIDLLSKFVDQRPGLDFTNYGDVRAYRSEMRGITNDRSDYYELLGFASRWIENLDEKLNKALSESSGRLTLNEGKLEYVTGQYFPTEYRPAACRVLANLLWNEFRNEKRSTGEPVYSDGNAIREAIKRKVSRRVAKNYFN